MYIKPAHPFSVTARVRAAYVGNLGVVDSDYIKDLVHKDGLWFAGQALVVPRVANLRHECMREMHDMLFSGHLGVTQTLKAVTRSFWWPIVKQDVKQCALSCNSCHKNKSSNQRRSGLFFFFFFGLQDSCPFPSSLRDTRRT